VRPAPARSAGPGCATQHKLVSDDQPEDGFTRALDAFGDVVLRILELPDTYGEGLSVRGVSLSYTDEDRMGCVVTCLKELAATDAPLVLNTPHLMELDLDNPEQAAMPAEMEEAIEALCEAAERYVKGHRAQGDLARRWCWLRWTPARRPRASRSSPRWSARTVSSAARGA